jgi:hypothetical protein
MPSPINHALQRDLLMLLRDVYPERLHEIPQIPEVSWESMCANLKYLEAHDLCESGLHEQGDGGFVWGGPSLTAKGLDYLEDDGGLSAILNVVTVKLHADTIRALLDAQIDASPIAPEEKSALKRLVSGLSQTALQAATTELVKTGLQHIPNVVTWLRAIAGV